jgi:hypothetical protein
MNRETNSQQQLNLSALRRLDPAIVDVLFNSAHVAVYAFDDTNRTWVLHCVLLFNLMQLIVFCVVAQGC